MCTSDLKSNDLGLTDKNHSCACGSGGRAHTEQSSSAHATAATGGDVLRAHYLVDGMTCNHCVSSVTEEVSALDGVDSVSVELNAGGTSRIMVVSSKPISSAAVSAAVADAGYSVVAGISA